MRHLYIHIPFCHRICPYCSFYKHTAGSTNIDEFVEAVLQEAHIYSKKLSVQPESIYIGGGTPTFLNSRALGRLLQGLRDSFNFADLSEWTVEANPATFDQSKALLMRKSGVTRISLGVQSWAHSELALLGRDHCEDDVLHAFTVLRDVDMPSINVDLMFSLPSQTLIRWRESLERTIDLKPEHVSAYNLTIEEDTEFFNRHQAGDFPLSEDRDAEHFYLADNLLGSAGYKHYEISNFAIDGHESVHNKGYWMGRDYLGLGPSAVSTIKHCRWTNIANTGEYVSRAKGGGSTIKEFEYLTPNDRTNEAIALQLRTSAGLSLAKLAHVPLTVIDSLRSAGFLEVQGSKAYLTRSGFPLADTIATELFL